MVEKILRKLGFKLRIIEAKLNLLDAYKKRSAFQQKIHSPLLFIREFSKHTQTCHIYLSHILITYNVLWMCAGGKSHAVQWGFCTVWAKRAIQNQDES